MRVSYLLMILTVAVCFATSVVAGDILDESAAIAEIEQHGGQVIDGRPRGLSVALEPIPSLVIPFWSLTVPLALISVWLLLSKPPKSIQKKITEPKFTEGT